MAYRYKRVDLPEIGELSYRIIFQEPVKQDDGYGGKVISWQDKFKAWAAIEPISANERFALMSVQHEVSHRVYIRSRDDVSPEMRIKYGNRIYEVKGILDLGNYMEIICNEVS